MYLDKPMRDHTLLQAIAQVNRPYENEAAEMETRAPPYLGLIARKFDDKDVDNLIEHFRDKERRKEFFKEYKEIEMLYEIISPDVFLRPFIEDYSTLSSLYAVVQTAYAKKVYDAFAKFPNWQRSVAELRELRNQVTFAVSAEENDLEKFTATVEALFTLLQSSTNCCTSLCPTTASCGKA